MMFVCCHTSKVATTETHTEATNNVEASQQATTASTVSTHVTGLNNIKTTTDIWNWKFDLSKVDSVGKHPVAEATHQRTTQKDNSKQESEVTAAAQAAVNSQLVAKATADTTIKAKEQTESKFSIWPILKISLPVMIVILLLLYFFYPPFRVVADRIFRYFKLKKG